MKFLHQVMYLTLRTCSVVTLMLIYQVIPVFMYRFVSLFYYHNIITHSSIIDLVCTNSLSRIRYCDTIAPLANSDHFGISMCVPWSSRSCHYFKGSCYTWDYNKADFEKANDLLSNYDWNTMFNDQPSDVDSIWSRWYEVFMNVMNPILRKTTV